MERPVKKTKKEKAEKETIKAEAKAERDVVLEGYIKKLFEASHTFPKKDEIILYIAEGAKSMKDTQKGKVFSVINGWVYCYWEKNGQFEVTVGTPARLTRVVNLSNDITEVDYENRLIDEHIETGV